MCIDLHSSAILWHVLIACLPEYFYSLFKINCLYYLLWEASTTTWTNYPPHQHTHTYSSDSSLSLDLRKPPELSTLSKDLKICWRVGHTEECSEYAELHKTQLYWVKLTNQWSPSFHGQIMEEICLIHTMI